MSRIAILTYHSLDESGSVVSVAPRLFAAQMARLAEIGFRGISLIQALDVRDRTGSWPGQTVVLTFDDGYANVYEHALPVLARLGFSATVYLVTGHVGGVNDWGLRPDRLPELPILDWSSVRELHRAGWEIGAHTVTHPDLRKLSRAAVERELLDSAQHIEKEVSRRTSTFAYPFGYRTPEVERAAAAAYRAAVTTELRRAGAQPLHLLPRIDTFYLQTVDELERAITGRMDGYLTLRRWARCLRQGFRA